MPLLEANFSVDYPGKPNALRGLQLNVFPGEVVGLAGESGSGKSTVALSLLRLIDHKGGKLRGRIYFDGRDLMTLKQSQMRDLRGREMALVLQSAASSLNPALRVGTQLAEAWKAHDASGDWKRSALDIFERVSLPADDAFLRRYPRELSVGQAQRVLIAMSILHRPKLLIADEPTSALDAITQSEVLDLLRQLNRELDMAILFISHDLPAIAGLCHRVAILDAGTIVESGPSEEIFRSPLHPYTRALLRAIPRYSVSATNLSTAME
jgi:ABC-type dipeptide/oligopeptide/nickel transport system ATPase component